MKRCTPFFGLLFLAINSGFLFAAGPELSGVFDSTVNYTNGTGDAPVHSWGIEEYINLRLRIKAGEKAVLCSAFNLVALSGSYASSAFQAGAAGGYIAGDNYTAALELERLYFRINGEYIDTEAGLLRMNFGYGQVWGSSDFLNPRNPLLPNARPRGVLGINASWYPSDSLKLTGFIAGPGNPLEFSGGGFIPGFSLDQHWDRASIQILYAFQTPLTASPWGIHRFGFSVKADLALGLVADALYSLNPDKPDKIDGLSAGAGFDYSFLGGDLYLLFEYLFNGFSSATAWNSGTNPMGWKNHHYLYGNALYRFNDYCSFSLSALTCFDDGSFSPFATLSYEVFQGFSLSLSVRVCLDQKDFSGGKTGELGPIPPKPDGSPGEAGNRVIVNAGARLRF